MKTKVFINLHYLEIGGVESSLIGLLQSLDPFKVSVDLFLNDPRGELIKFIPDWINIIDSPQSYRFIERPLRMALKRGFLKIVVARLLAKINFKRYRRKEKPFDDSAIFGYVGHYVTPVLPSLKHLGEYDLAVSFLAPHDIVLKKINAKRKVCWIHTDYTAIDVNKNLELPVWRGFDNIVSISDDVTKTFCKAFPKLKNKIIKIENIISPNFINQRSNAFIPDEIKQDKTSFNLLTIGRFSYQKNLDSIPSLCKSLIDNGLSIKWYIMGFGSEAEEEKIKSEIKYNSMEDCVIMLGKRENPYPYIKACDFYIQPSRYEGKSITVREAQILGKPVIIRNYPTAASQIIDGLDGFIGSYDLNLFAKDLLRIIKSKERIERVKCFLASKDWTQSEDLEKFYKLATGN